MHTFLIGLGQVSSSVSSFVIKSLALQSDLMINHIYLLHLNLFVLSENVNGADLVFKVNVEQIIVKSFVEGDNCLHGYKRKKRQLLVAH